MFEFCDCFNLGYVLIYIVVNDLKYSDHACSFTLVWYIFLMNYHGMLSMLKISMILVNVKWVIWSFGIIK